MVSAELIEACRRGDPGAFEELVERTRGRVYSLAFRLVRDPHEAEDVSQEAYVRVFRGLPGFRQEARFETWLHRVVTNTAFTHLKRRGRFGDVLAEGQVDAAERVADPDAPMEQALDRDELKRALDGLSPGLRVVTVLKDVYGLPVRDIAAEIGISEAAVKVRLHRARKKLKEALWTKS
ncbi:MAG TPA: RNA polymerase sigma factor [Actinomycetota bacterium]|jgi:RNA polymerase sigma-70 factor (ECF subfamily)